MRTAPQTLPQGLWDAAARKGPQSPTVSSIPRQLTGQGPQRTQSPLARHATTAAPISAQNTGNDWVITPQDKARFDQLFVDQDREGRGFITGDQAVPFFSTSGLSEDTLAMIWDLADINSEGQLNKDEFAVAMYLIRQERSKTTGRGNLPSSLPPRLIPPSMRRQAIPPSQPTAPTFDNAANASQQPKSAADDLFGLDALSAEPVQKQPTAQPQDPFLTGDRPTSPASPPASAAASRPRPGEGTTFKPFQPTSAFGQGLTTQATGGSIGSDKSTSRNIPQQATVNDDLLGDTDPEINKKFTAETTELANMSNQVGNLRNQMQEVQNKKSINQREVASSSSQKQALEARLAQFRTQYEQEVREVKALEERLRASRNETQKLSQDLAMLEGTHTDLKNQHQQLSTAFDADQRENSQLKERTSQMNSEINQLRPALEKLRNDARQQKGLVAINKKQLATSEGERDKMVNEKSELEKSIEQSRSSSPATSREPPASGFASPVAGVTSPAPSTGGQSMNPFFRKASTQSVERSIPATSPKQDFSSPAGTRVNAFEDFFGPTEAASKTDAPPPTTSFPNSSQQNLSQGSQGTSTPISGLRTPSSPNPQVPVSIETPQASNPPPPPPESRQITSSALPLRTETLHTDSPAASVKVHPPASRSGFSDMEGTATPGGSSTAASVNGDETPSRAINPAPINGQPSRTVNSDLLPSSNQSKSIPGSFPGETESPVRSTPTGGSTASENAAVKMADSQSHALFASQSSSHATDKDEFESAFAGADLQNASAAQSRDPFAFASDNAKGKGKGNTEFPPIQDLQPDESDSDSDSEQGFDDSFVTQPHNTSANQQAVASPDSTLPAPRPVLASNQSTASSLPTPNAQPSPPAYDSTAQKEDTSHFPKQYEGLLPSREASLGSPGPSQSPPASVQQITSPLHQVTSPQSSTSANHETLPLSSELKQVANEVPDRTGAADDFDSAFDDLDEAKEDDQGNETLGTEHKDDFDFNNPMFSTPADSRDNTFSSSIQHTPTSSAQPTSVTNIRTSTESHPFGTSSGNTFNASSSSTGATQPQSSDLPSTMSAQSHDWDAIFSGLDKPASESATSGLAQLGKSPFAPDESWGTSQGGSSQQRPGGLRPPRADSAKRPDLGRAISTGTEHDDPILKELVGMGYARGKALAALEKYDYNIEKVRIGQRRKEGN